MIQKFFPNLTQLQLNQYKTLVEVCSQWNTKINVISRKDIGNLEVHHILHSLAIAKFINFVPDTTIIDLGTGGGFPALPLAIFFPDSHFHLVDRISKKLRVAEEIARACGLKNVTFQQGDFSECKFKADFIVSRAVMPLFDLIKTCRKNISKINRNPLPNGLITLKGGDLSDELSRINQPVEIISVSSYFPGIPHFTDKFLIYLSL